MRGRARVARAAEIAVATVLLSIGPFNAIREATSNDMSAILEGFEVEVDDADFLGVVEAAVYF